jgi:hypothetical protein
MNILKSIKEDLAYFVRYFKIGSALRHFNLRQDYGPAFNLYLINNNEISFFTFIGDFEF